MLVAEIQNQSPDLVDKFHRKPHVYKVGKCTMPSILKCVLHGYKSASVISVKVFEVVELLFLQTKVHQVSQV